MTGGPEDRPGRFRDPENQALLNENSPEFRGYMDELYRRLPAYARRAATIPPGTRGSVEWFGEVGKFWWRAREESGLTRYQLAECSEVPVNRIRFLEFGLALPEEVDDESLRRYADVLGNCSLYDTYKHRFDPSPTRPKP